MKWIVSLALLAAGAALAWMFAAPNQATIPTQTVAFDNVYKGATMLTVYLTVDGGVEQKLTAECTPQTCTLKAPIANGRHNLSLVIEQNGQRSRPATLRVE